MIPGHCREVGVKRTSFELTEENIRNALEGKKLYTATKYLVLHNGDKWAVCTVTKPEGFELFRNAESLEVLSLPDETAYVEDPEVDVLNPSKLVAKAEEVGTSTGAKTVVVKGRFDHISFAYNETLVPVVVFEAVPPNPPKLVKLAENVVEGGRLGRPVKLITEYLKVDDNARSVEADSMVFPCNTSGLAVEGKKIFYLDELPELAEMTGKVVLVGCSLSDRIFKSHYHRKPEFVNICPADNVDGIKKKYPNTPILLKCCKFKDDFEIEGDLIKVPWGTTTRIIEDALNKYFEDHNNHFKDGD